jgi:hypothetical protein
MRQLDKNDLAQMNRDYFQSLEKERLVEVATYLHKLVVEQWEKLLLVRFSDDSGGSAI